MKTLTDLAVLQAAEELMFKNGQTTTLDVKTLLREQDYQATQSEVSARVEILSKQEAWQTNSAGAYRVYKPAPDTTQTIESYWEFAAQEAFWEIKAAQTNVHITTGRQGTDGQIQTTTYRTNREAIRQGQLLIQEKRNEGYKLAQDTRLPFTIRQHFATQFAETPQTICLAYYGVKQARKSRQEETQELKEGGYEFEWHLPTDSQQLQTIWQKDVWSPLDYQISPVACLGEKTNYAHTPDGKTTTYAIASQETDWKPTHLFEVQKNQLFQAKITFANGSVLRLNRYDAIFSETKDMRQPSFTFWSSVHRFITL